MKTAEAEESALRGSCDQTIIRLPLGLLGFEGFKEYLWLQCPQEAPFSWMQARQDPTLTFLIIPPSAVLSTYTPDVPDEDASFLELSSSDDAILFAIVTLRAKGSATMNLKGPIVLNRHTLRGKQIVLSNAADYPLQYPLHVIA